MITSSRTRCWLRSSLVIALLATSLVSHSDSPQVSAVSWPELVDAKVQVYEDPYRDLNHEQSQQLAGLLYLKRRLEDPGLSPIEKETLIDKGKDLESQLEAGGVDVNWLLAQRAVVAQRRQKAAIGINESLDHRVIQISGFLFPGEYSEDGQYSAFLLPTRGICMHLPSPPPNQLIRVLMPKWPDIEPNCVGAILVGQLSRNESKTELPTLEHERVMWNIWQLDLLSARYPDYE